MRSNNWEKVKLGDLCQVNENTYSVSEKWEFVNYLDTGNLTEDQIQQLQYIETEKDRLPSRARRKVKYDDILYSTVRPNQRHYGIIKEIVPNMLVSTGFAVISVDKSRADSDFIYYYLTQNKITETLHVIGEQSTSAYPSIKPSDITNLELFLPSLEEQKKISKILRLLDKKIANNKRVNHHLGELINTIYLMFIESSEQLETKKLGELFDTETATFNPTKTSEKKVNHFSLPAFDDNQYPLVDETENIKSNKNIVKEYSVLVSKLNPATKRVWAPFTNQNLLSVCSTEFISLAGKDKNEQAILFAIINSQSFQDYFIAHATGTTNSRQRTKPSVAYEFEVPYNKIQFRQLGILLSPLLTQIEENLHQIQKLTQIRDNLLPELLSGRLLIS